MLKRTTVREVLYYEYAKIIANRILKMDEKTPNTEAERRRYWGLVRSEFEKLNRGVISPRGVLRENKMLVLDEAQSCSYCGSTVNLQWDHIIALSRGGPDCIDNLVRACRVCNLRKGQRTISEYYEDRWHQIPKLVRSKYVKLLLAEHERQGTMDWTEFPPGQELSMRNMALIFSAWRSD